MTFPSLRHAAVRISSLAAILVIPSIAFAQASPFDTGASSLVSFALTIATPIAILIVIGLAIAATCDLQTLIDAGGRAGNSLFAA